MISAERRFRSFRIVDREKQMALLGRSVFEHGRLTPSALACGVSTLERMAKRAERQRVDQCALRIELATPDADELGLRHTA